MTDLDIKVTTTTVVKKEFTIDEGELESLPEEYGRQMLGADESVPVSVRIDCGDGFVREVTFTSEFEKAEVS